MESKIHNLAQFIAAGEISAAKRYALDIAKEFESKEYAKCFIAVLLTQTAIKLEENIKNFYCDKKETELLALEKFPDNITLVIDNLNLKVKAARLEDETMIYKKAKEYIDKNITNKQLCVDLCADYTGVSASALARIFLKNMHLSPFEYICRKRISMALALLRKGNISINETAQMTGFFSSATFIRVFKRHLGITPGKYRFMNQGC